MRFHAPAVVAAALLLAVAAPSRAQEARPGPYGGLIVSQLSYKQSGADAATLTNAGGLVGLVISPHWALEGRVGLGVDEDRIVIGSTPVDFKLDSYTSGLVKGILPLAPRFAIYGLAGVTIGKFRASNPALSVDKWETDFSYGAGVEFGFLPSASLSLEWQRLFEGSGYNLDAANVALSLRF